MPDESPPRGAARAGAGDVGECIAIHELRAMCNKVSRVDVKGTERQLQRPRYRIGAVARMTGISAHALRAWERRYGALNPDRAEGGGRLYSEADVARLRIIRQLLERGHAIGQLARVPADELQRLLAEQSGPLALALEPAAPPRALVRRLVSAVRHLALLEADQMLARAAIAFEPRRLTDEVVRPLLDEVSRRCRRGRLRVVHEQAAYSLLRGLFATVSRMHLPPKRANVALVATPDGERREWGALPLAFQGLVEGWRVLYLGPGLPSVDLAEAARTTGSTLVLVSVVDGDAQRTVAELRALARALPSDVELVATGPAAESAARALVGVRVISGAEELGQVFAAAKAARRRAS